MRVAALSDIHGNLPALDAVLAGVERESPDLIVVCGDVASGPMPAETIDRLMSLAEVRFVRGNADRGLVDAFDRRPPSPMPGPFADWCATQITQRQRDFLAGFEPAVTLEDVEGIGRVLFCHASPRNDTDVFTALSSDERVRALVSGVEADLVVCGHTHMQFDRSVDGLRVVNPGSVGMPYGEPGACWAMVGPQVSFRRTDYDRQSAAARIQAAGSPSSDQFARENVLTVPSVDEAMEFLGKAETAPLAQA